MKKTNRYIVYIFGIMAMLCLILGLIRSLNSEEIRKGGLKGKTESELDIPDEYQQEGSQGTVPNENIRVLLMTSGYGDILHDSVSLAADSGLIICRGDQEEEWTGGILTLTQDDERFAEGKITVKPLNEGEEIRVESIERGCGIPAYAGVIEIWSGEEGMVMINELPLEQYLCKVVPSEMPSSYEMEALKAQAVCARSYACRQMGDYAYPQYEAHVNDSTEFQVYNNSYTADSAFQAVMETAGQVVRYQGNIATTYYYSTSCGRTTDMEAWGSAPNERNAYLKCIEVCGDEGDYEKDLPWYRWQAEISAETLAALIGDYANQNLGALENVEVTRRGPGDVALELTATGTEGTVTVETENKIRTALGGTGYTITKNDGSVVDSQKLLPSAFFTITKQDETYVIEGGGYGHGIGMSQNGANEMAKNGKTYREILELFYQNVTIE
ncbi:MAG: SpoIID/LytB domain-containing protein [Eubacteriales bacterium]|nr:SpoIID/LytB domain-containing protein [Eubacteriales bacterium]